PRGQGGGVQLLGRRAALGAPGGGCDRNGDGDEARSRRARAGGGGDLAPVPVERAREGRARLARTVPARGRARGDGDLVPRLPERREWAVIEGVVVAPLRQIPDERGRVMHMLRASDPHFKGFGEIYFSVVYPGVVKGWHLHTKMVLNYAVPQ